MRATGPAALMTGVGIAGAYIEGSTRDMQPVSLVESVAPLSVPEGQLQSANRSIPREGGIFLRAL
jgi:hypothetical protein